jgi:hypothetical protein
MLCIFKKSVVFEKKIVQHEVFFYKTEIGIRSVALIRIFRIQKESSQIKLSQMIIYNIKLSYVSIIIYLCNVVLHNIGCFKVPNYAWFSFWVKSNNIRKPCYFLESYCFSIRTYTYVILWNILSSKQAK